MMNYDNDELVTAAIARAKNTIFTALPAKIIAYDPSTATCSAQPMLGIDSETTEMIPPRIDGVPIYFPSGGGATMTFPVKPDDICLLVFSMFPIEEWIDSTGKQVSFSNGGRTHDITDAFAFVGIGTKRTNAHPHPENVEIKYGSSKIIVKKDGNTIIEGHLHVTNGITTDKSVEATENVIAGQNISAVNGNITAPNGDIIVKNLSLYNHVHHYTWTDGAGEADTEKGK